MIAQFKEKGLFWVGMILSLVIVLWLVWFCANALIRNEANFYGRELLERLKVVVGELDQEVSHSLTSDLYQQLHRKPLATLSLEEMEEIHSGVNRLATIVKNWHGAVALFTDCPKKDKSLCYEQFTPSAHRKEGVVREGYDPKSRPWYIATRSHSDWVLLHFMIRSRSRETGYPTTWGVGLVKHVMESPEEEEALKVRASNKELFAKELEDESGIWLLLSFATSNLKAISEIDLVPTYPFLNMLYQGNPHPFKKFDLSLKTLRFSKEMLASSEFPEITCNSLIHSFGFSYDAQTSCQFQGEFVQFIFSKNYDHPFYILFLVLLGLVFIFLSFCFFRFVYQQRIIVEKVRENQRVEMLLEKRRHFPQIEDHDLLPLDQEAYRKFVKEVYGGFPHMARARGLDLNHIYRVNRKFKKMPYLVFKYDTIREIVGIYEKEEASEKIKTLLADPKILVSVE